MAEHILTGPTKLKTVGEQSRRKESAQYYLTVNGAKICVCRSFLCVHYLKQLIESDIIESINATKRGHT